MYCGTWQRFAKVVLSPCGDIAYRWMTILDALRDRRSRLFSLDLRPCPLRTEIPPDSLNLLTMLSTVEGEISKSLPIFLWGTLFLNISIIFSCFCWQTGDPLRIFAPKGLDISWMLLLYQIIITITCWHHLFQITSFKQFTSLLALNCSCPNFFGMCCRSEWQERRYIYKWHEVDQTKHEIFCVHIVCNEIQVKVNLEITTFFFYLHFTYWPNFFWFGVVIFFTIKRNISKYTNTKVGYNVTGNGVIWVVFVSFYKQNTVKITWIWQWANK